MQIIEKKKRTELKRTNDTSNSATFFANTGTSNLRWLAIKFHMWKIASSEEIIKNCTSVKQSEQSSSFMKSILIKMRFL